MISPGSSDKREGRGVDGCCNESSCIASETSLMFSQAVVAEPQQASSGRPPPQSSTRRRAWAGRERRRRRRARVESRLRFWQLGTAFGTDSLQLYAFYLTS